jgi:hypothetical protein
VNNLKRLLAAAGFFLVFSFAQAAPAMADQTDPAITQGLCTGANLNLYDTSCAGNGQSEQSINKIIHTIINLLSIVVGVIAVIMIIVGGLRYITSGGSDTGITSAKNTILYAIIGLIIVALAQVMVRFVLRQLTNG